MTAFHEAPVRCIQPAFRWLARILLAGAGLLAAGQGAGATNRIAMELDSNRVLHLAFPSLTTEYHLVSYSDSLTGSLWGLTGALLGAEGAIGWQDEESLGRSGQLFYRVLTRPVTAPADSDGDGMDDVFELRHAAVLDPLNPADAEEDADGDGLDNLAERLAGTDLQNADTDGDGLGDRDELVLHGTSPVAADTDGDGLPDGWELDHDLDALSDGGVSQGLAAWWTFDEGEGAVASNRLSPDWAGALRNMTAAQWVEGRSGGALQFDGSNDYVAVSQAGGAVVTGAPFTVTAVIWQEADSTLEYPTVVSDGQLILTNRWPGFALRYWRSRDWLTGYASGTNAAVAAVRATNWLAGHAGRWTDVALTHDGTAARLFVDGREVHAAPQAFDAFPQLELLIGAGHVNSSASYWKGKIDEVRIYRTALGETELAEVNDWLGDADGDGLGNGREWERGTDPNSADTDGDGLGDYEEVLIHGTDPLSADTDGDGMPDAWELANGLIATVDDAAEDADGDGLTNLDEHGYQTDPQAADPDGDGLNDYAEVVTHGTDPFDADTDGDGLSDYAEVMTHQTNPLLEDTDSDGLPDGWEAAKGTDPNAADADADPDGDGLTNLQEMNEGTDPYGEDTDGDGLPDGWETVQGLNPLVSDAQADSDGDGLTNLQEFGTGTDPLDMDTEATA